MKEQIGLNFAAALRSFLRQDPNIILVGEIRDFETAEIAIKAALTGHLVLSTLHTNDAPSTISRLMNMGVEPFLVATSVQHHLRPAAGAPHLRQLQGSRSPPAARGGPAQGRLHAGGGQAGHHHHEGRGLRDLQQTRLQGPRGSLRGPGDVRDPQGHDPDGRPRHRAEEARPSKEGMITLRRSGCRKVLDGVTTIEEIIRETVL